MELLKKQIESLLFIFGEPLTLKDLSRFLKKNPEEINQALALLKEEYQLGKRGLILIENNGAYQLTTSPEVSEIISDYLKETLKEELTPAALETLAIIAYKGPITRAAIENIRGVNSSFILRSLLIRGLIEREPDPSRPQAFLYRISFELLRMLGLQKIEDLPEYQKFHSL